MSENEYWAACEIQEIASEVRAKFDQYADYLKQHNYLDKIRTSYQRYYNLDQEGAYRVTKSDDGSITRVTLNHYKNLLKRTHILITQSKLAFLPKSRNSDTKSLIDTDLAKGILEYYGDEKALNYTFSRAVETALVCLESFVHCPWNLHKGQELTADENGQTIYSGDQDFEVLTALDVARNIQVPDSDYYIVRTRRNKWDLAAMHPEFEDVITAHSDPQQDSMSQYRLQTIYPDYETDLVDVYYFYHRNTPALPDGRFTVVVNGQVLADGTLGYKRPPVYRLSAGDMIDTIFGDSPGTDLLAIQEVINALATAVVSNNMNHAQQNIWSPDPNLSVKQLAHGQNLVTSSVKPEALQLTASAAETYKLLDSLVAQQQLLSGINDTARGNPESNVKNNGSMALMLAQAVQFVSDLQKSYAQLASDVGTAVIDNMKTFAKGPMLVAIGGQSRKAYIREFQSKDIINVERVTVDLGDPIAQTTAGRWEMIQGWRQAGTITPRQEVEFLRTGQFDSILEDKFRDAILVRSENEMLKKGEAPVVLMTDDHPYHVIEHNKLLNDPEARYNPELVNAITQHMMEHKLAAQSIDPALMALLAGQMPPPQMPAPMPGAPIPPEQMPVGGQENAQMPPVPEGTPPESAEPYAQATQQGVLPQ